MRRRGAGGARHPEPGPGSEPDRGAGARRRGKAETASCDPSARDGEATYEREAPKRRRETGWTLTRWRAAAAPRAATPWDDKLHEECGVYGVFGIEDASTYVALGLHALQHRGQEAAGIVSHDAETGFNTVRRIGHVRDNFTKQSVMDLLPGRAAIGHTRYSTAGRRA